MNIATILKFGLIIVIILESILLGLIPIKVAAFRDNKNALSIANAFSGGVFLSIALIHIVPDQGENLRRLMDYRRKHLSDNSSKHILPKHSDSNAKTLHSVSFDDEIL